MRIGKVFVLLFALFSCYAGQAQEIEKFDGLACAGTIPDVFLGSSTSKYKHQIQQLQASDAELLTDPIERMIQEQFLLESNFSMDEILRSGQVLFNDPVSNYLNKVIHQLTTDRPALRDQVQAYVLRSETVNAFATNRGSIFVSLGLISRMETEAQLAYILAHELAHIEEEHARELYLKTVRREKELQTGAIPKDWSMEDFNFTEHQYSKEIELLADSLGLIQFLKTSYSFDSLNAVYEVLKYPFQLFGNAPFDPSFFEGEGYRFPEEYLLEEVRGMIGEDEGADDSDSTHPNIRTRKALLEHLTSGIASEGRQEFLVSEEEFNYAQDLTRMELALVYLQNGNFSEAIYCAYVLNQQYPDHLFLRKLIGKALYIEAKFSNDSDYYFDGNYENIEGEIQRLYYFFQQLGQEEITILALRYNLQTEKMIPDDPEIRSITDDLFIELAWMYPMLAPFSKSEKDNPEEDSEYWQSAFLQLHDDQFKERFEEALLIAKERQVESLYSLYLPYARKQKKEERKKRNRGLQLGIDKIVLVNPTYLKYDWRALNGMLYLEGEAAQETFQHTLQAQAEEIGLEIRPLDFTQLQEGDVQQFNQLRLLTDWFNQHLQQVDLSPTVGYQQNQIDQLAAYFGTKYFLWTNVAAFQKSKETFFYATLFNVVEGTSTTLKFEYLNRRDRPFLIKGHVFDMLAQIKRR